MFKELQSVVGDSSAFTMCLAVMTHECISDVDADDVNDDNVDDGDGCDFDDDDDEDDSDENMRMVRTM